ncbi:hypothetical protein KNV00_gp055 [Streptomyces phage Bmoc]|uniref:Uncharacterized protein n=1 Tax=Streptomyces phage Bmoc TaxID=2725629 RepID=A0A6M3TAT9_9CAUD|nr:hypothetical protein KNV00_gp055 [Streptomyces phage Bmoc]QJD50964.1 hypothetical protein SEA_BMOC_256 [Streptomyces phage Bmoc]
MQVLLKMNPGLEMWFGEVVWTDEYWDDDEDWPEDGCLGVGYAYSPFSFLHSLIWFHDFLVMEFLVRFLVGRADCQRSENAR